MPRTVKSIIDEDETKPAAPGTEDGEVNKNSGVDDEGILVGDDGEIQETAKVPVKKAAVSTEEQATALKKQLAEASERAEAAERRAEEADKRAGAASTTAATARAREIEAAENSIKTKITNAKTQLDSVKQQLKQARAAGDTDAEVDLQDAMTNARYELNAAEWEDKNFVKWKEDQKKIAARPAVTGEETSPYTVKERKWITEHPEFNTNKKFARVAKVAAQEARDDGHAQDSKGYFQYIEDALAEVGLMGDDEDPTSGAGDDTRTSTSTAASPNKDGGAKSTVGKNPKYPHIPSGFRIPPEWVQAAQDLDFEDPREYANMRLEEEAKDKANR